MTQIHHKMILSAKYRARLSSDSTDIDRAVSLRKAAFRTDERDSIDDRAEQLLVEDAETGALAACLRLLTLEDGTDLSTSYSAGFYDLDPFADLDGPIVEIGRFCQSPALRDPAILRVAWTALARHVLTNGTRMFMGCSSFRGAYPALHGPALAALRDRYLLPPARQPGKIAAETFDFASASLPEPDPRGIPTLLRSYLAIGGQVSSHAVVDHALGTMHVFTALDIASIPPARARLLTEAALA